MNEPITAAEALSALHQSAKVFRAFEYAEKAISVLAGLEQNERELRTTIAKLQRESELAAQAVLKAKGDAAKTVASAEEQARSIVESAESLANNVRTKAAADAKEVADLARMQCEGWQRDRNLAMESAKQAIDKRDTAMSELSSLEQRIAEARSTIAKMLK